MAFAPPLYIDTRTTVPAAPYGLLDAADQVVPEDPKVFNGIEVRDDCRMNATLNASDCGDEFTFDLGDDGPGIGAHTVAPVRLYAGFSCLSVGLTQDIYTREATAALTNSAPAALEKFLWTPAADHVDGEPDQLHLMGPDTVVLAGGDALSFVAGVRALEDYLAGHYGRVGVIHAPAGLSADAGLNQQVQWAAGKPVTTKGTRWSWGAYPYADPEGADADAGTAWMVATGAITLRQSPVKVLTDMEHSINRANNQVFAIATKTYVVEWSCVTAAVLVTLT